MDQVEQAVIDELGRAQVVVHAEPDAVGERANDRIAAAALRVPGVVETHNITVLEQPRRPRRDAARAAAGGHDPGSRPARWCRG